jgi:hypothetical protein
MTVLLDAAGRRRSPATMPGYHAGRPPGNKGMRYPADPPTVDEIVAVMRHATDDRHGWRIRAMIVVLWRAGLRVQEALALAEHDLDERRGSLFVRNGKGRPPARGRDGRMGLGAPPAVAQRTDGAPGRAAVLHHRRAHARTTVVGRRGSQRKAPARASRRSQASLRAAPAAPRARARTGPARVSRSTSSSASWATPTSAPPPSTSRASTPRRSSPPCAHAGADDVRQRRAATLSHEVSWHGSRNVRTTATRPSP